MKWLRQLFKYVPSEHFKLPIKDFYPLYSTEINGQTYEVFKHKESRLQIIVNVETLEVEGIKIGNIIL
jgi:hypothetical protein